MMPFYLLVLSYWQTGTPTIGSLVDVELLENPKYRNFLHGTFPWIVHDFTWDSLDCSPRKTNQFQQLSAFYMILHNLSFWLQRLPFVNKGASKVFRQTIRHERVGCSCWRRHTDESHHHSNSHRLPRRQQRRWQPDGLNFADGSAPAAPPEQKCPDQINILWGHGRDFQHNKIGFFSWHFPKRVRPHWKFQT